MLIRDIITETTAGAVATVAVPMGKMIKRPNPSVFPKKKKKVSEGERFCVQVDGEKKTHHKTKKEAEEYAKHLKSKGHKGDIKVVSIDLPQYESLSEGEERSIIRDATIDYLLDEFGGDNWKIFADTKEELEQQIYSKLEILSVDEVVDPNMEVGGQRIDNFANGRVIDVISANDVIDSVMSQINIDEGKSPHKKGTKKYKKHMAAMHAGG